jgi:hypothetical protein
VDYAITPAKVLAQVAQAIPEDLRADIIIVGSLAASYHLLKDSAQSVRTKDVDGMVSFAHRFELTLLRHMTCLVRVPITPGHLPITEQLGRICR